MTSDTYTTVFFVPMMLRSTSMLGSERAGPASSSASAGPFPMPEPMSPCRMGTSVRVAKYMNAPTTEEKRLARNELPPTDWLTHSEGIKRFVPGSPEQHAGDKHATDQQREDLLRQRPGRVQPLAAFAGIPGTEHRQPSAAHDEGNQRLMGEGEAQDDDRQCRQRQFPPLEAKPQPQRSPQARRERARHRPFPRKDSRPESGRLRRLAPIGEHQQAHHRGEEHHVLPKRTFDFDFGHLDCRLGLGLFLAPEDEVHGQPHDDAEAHRPDRPRHAQFHPEYPRGHDDGQDIDRRARVEERRGRAESRTARPDTAKERQHRAGTHGENGSGDRGDSVGHGLVRFGPQVTHHRGLVDECADAPGDEQGWDEAEEHMLLRVPFGQFEAFLEGVVKAGHSHRQEEQHQKEADKPGEDLEFAAPGRVDRWRHCRCHS